MTIEELKLIKRALWIINPCQIKTEADKILTREIELQENALIIGTKQ